MASLWGGNGERCATNSFANHLPVVYGARRYRRTLPVVDVVVDVVVFHRGRRREGATNEKPGDH